MLDFLIQLAAAAGPIALAIMGVVVSLNPPSPKWNRTWAGAFAIVGILAAAAIFFELRGTDQLLGKIWEHIREPQPAVAKTGARLFFNVADSQRTLDVNISNNGDVMARVNTVVISRWALFDHVLTNKEEDDFYRSALNALQPMGSGMEVPVNFGHITEFEFPNLTDQQYDSIINGMMNFYLVVITSFKDELTPSGRTNIASVCTRFIKNTNAGFACSSHIESRLQN